MKRLLALLWYYRQARRLRFGNRAVLLAHQQAAITRHLAWIARNSPFYAPWADQPLAAWPLVDKETCLAHFDRMNTAGLKLAEVEAVALRAEASRDFQPTLGGYTVGLSSGTSGRRGVFAVTANERTRWAGLVLARLLPDGLLHGARIAFFLRADSALYGSVRTPWINFRFFDLLISLDAQLAALRAYAPSIIVAPTQVLRQLALVAGDLRPQRTISVAEVLEADDRALIASAFGEIAEVYQATEGFLAYTCRHGTLHINEEYLHIEPAWLDTGHTRFQPVITDFSRTTQPVIRYRLDDVLAISPQPCPCGNPALALSHVEGRCDDQLTLPAHDGSSRVIFADSLSRLLLQALPLHADYRLVQTGPRELRLYCPLDPLAAEAALAALNAGLAGLGVASDLLRWHLVGKLPPEAPGAKRRRIVRGWRMT
jgi:putative adenylate-forming enzyme